MHRPREEARIEQVQDRVFDAADILIDIHPVFGLGQIGRRGGARCGEAGEVPRRIDKGVHRVRLAPGRFAAGGAGHVAPGRVTVQRVAGDVKGHIVGQLDGQVFLFLGHHAAGVAMHDRDRAAPIALTGQAPVAQAELGHAMTDTVLFAEIDGCVDGFVSGLDLVAGDQAGIADLFRFGRHEGRGLDVVIAFGRKEGVDDRQAVFRCEFVVAFVMAGAAEDRAGAVVHQDEVGDIDRQLPGGVEGVADLQPGVKAQLFGLFQRLFGGAALAGLFTEGCNLGRGFLKILGQRVVGRNADEGGPHQRVGAGGIDLDPVMAVGRIDQREGELQPARLADPVGLHGLHLGGPVVQRIQRGQKLVRVIRDLEEPLRQLAPFDQRAGPPAAPVLDLFVGQNGHVDRIPVHHGVLAVDQALFQEIQEQRLLLAVVFRVAGGEHPRPVQREAKRLHLRDHRVDVGIGPVLGVAAIGHRGVFRRHPEGVKAHGVQHVVAGGHLVARDNVAHGVIAHVTDVDAPRGVGEHLKHVILGLVGGAFGVEHPGLVPGLLPFRFDLGGGIARHAGSFLKYVWRG